jgi:hypothetical protein
VGHGGGAPARKKVGLRNAAIYGGYALIVFVVQAVLYIVLSEVDELPLMAPFCLLVFPALAWAAGWLSIGALFPAGAEEEPDRSPILGVAVCLIPNLLLCGVFGIFSVISRVF